MSKKITSTAIIAIGLVLIIIGFSISNKNKSTKQKHIQVNNEPITIKIGYTGPLTGPVSAVGIPVKNAFALAASELPSIPENKIEIIYEDDKCDPKTAVEIFNKFLNVDKVDYIVNGVCSASALPMAPLAEKEKKILISSISASPDLTHAGDYIFRTSASSEKIAQATAAELSKKSVKSIAILAENNAYTIGWMEALKKEFTQVGGKISAEERFDSQETELSTHLSKLSESNSDILVFIAISTPTARRVIDAYIKLGINTSFIGSESFGFESILEEYKEVLEGNYIATYNIGFESGEWEKLKNNYIEKFGGDYQTPYLLTLSYDTYAILNDGITKCGKDNECMKNFLYSIKDWRGTSGAFSLDKNGDAIHNFILTTVHDGKLSREQLYP